MSEQRDSARYTALARSDHEAMYEAIVRASVDAILTVSETGIIESVNPSTERMFGYTSAELIGRNVSCLMPAPYCEEHDHYLERYRQTGKASIIGIGRQVTGRRKDGSIFPIDLAVTEVHAGGRRRFTGIIHDITNRTRAEEAITRISESERQQIGQELHDAIGQDLTGISLMAKVLAGKLRNLHPLLEAEAEDITNLASKVTQDCKRLAHGLYPTELVKHGLSDALRELAMNNEHLNRVRMHYTEVGSLPRLGKDAAQHLYRIVQEASNNAIRHGGAKSIDVVIECTGPQILLTIADDGKGLPPEPMREQSGMGLVIMGYRAGALGGTFQIRGNTPKGTIVSCTIPLPSTRTEQTNG